MTISKMKCILLSGTLKLTTVIIEGPCSFSGIRCLIFLTGTKEEREKEGTGSVGSR